MRIIKFTHKNGKDKFMEIVKISSVLFDSRPGWILVREIDKIARNNDVMWIHPSENKIDWVRNFG